MRHASEDRLVPPDDLIFFGGVGFEEVGEEFVAHFVRLCGLQPHESVLDVGCGIGRIALPLARFLTADARYEGFDVVRAGIDWCRENITARYPNFAFRHVDLHNSMYNPEGKLAASDFTFPYRDASFDFVFATSVFTHMLPADVGRYLHEIVRVLRPAGRCLVTFLIADRETRARLAAGAGPLTFQCDCGDHLLARSVKAEELVAYDEDAVLRFYEQCGLAVRSIHYGAWSGRPEFLSWQDIVLASRSP